MSTPDPTENATDQRPEPGATRFRVQVAHPDGESIVIGPAGEIDDATVEHLEQVLWPHLSARVRIVVADLGGVGFLSVAGLDLLRKAHLHARAHGVDLRLVSARHEITHALEVAGLDTAMRCYPTVARSLARSDAG